MNTEFQKHSPDFSDASAKNRRLPAWIRTGSSGGRERTSVRNLLRQLSLHSVCESARCPNQGECWNRRTATFMIMGGVCTRNCAFCAVSHGQPEVLRKDEGERIAKAAFRLKLRHVVITSVTRDDLPDGGAGHFANVIRSVRRRIPAAGIEVLTPDFQGSETSLLTVLEAGPDVFNHNIETCERLTGQLRDLASYRCSLEILRRAADLGPSGIVIKSGFMLGLGEQDQEIRQLLQDLRENKVSHVTIGQYLQANSRCRKVIEFVKPEKFSYWQRIALQEYGFRHVESGPLVRSSYMAEKGLK